MGDMTALEYLGRPAADRPVEPSGLVLIATGVLIWTGEFKQLNISIQKFLDGLGLDVTSST